MLLFSELYQRIRGSGKDRKERYEPELNGVGVAVPWPNPALLVPSSCPVSICTPLTCELLVDVS